MNLFFNVFHFLEITKLCSKVFYFIYKFTKKKKKVIGKRSLKYLFWIENNFPHLPEFLFFFSCTYHSFFFFWIEKRLIEFESNNTQYGNSQYEKEKVLRIFYLLVVEEALTITTTATTKIEMILNNQKTFDECWWIEYYKTTQYGNYFVL